MDAFEPRSLVAMPRLRSDHMNEGTAMRTGIYTCGPTANRRAALASAGAVAERIASDSHAPACKGGPTVAVSKSVADAHAQRGRGKEKFARSKQLRERAAGVAQKDRLGRLEIRATSRRVRRRLGALAVGMIAVLFGVADAAFAGSANTDQFRRPGASADTIQAKYRAYDGETNEVEISRATFPRYTGNDWIEFRDRVPINAWWGWGGSHGCDHGVNAGLGVGQLYDPFFARCSHWSLFSELELDLGDKDDRLQVHPTTPTRLAIKVQGGDGNDDIDIRDGAAGDSVDCGAGTDWAFIDPGDTRTRCENESLGQITWDSPAVASRGRDRLDVFVRGADDGLWARSNNGQGWSGWERDPSGLVLTSAPAAATWGKYLQTNGGVDTFTGPVDVFARGADNALWHTWRGNAWSGQRESLGHPPSGPLTSAPTVASWGEGRLDVFVRGSDNRLWQRTCDIPISAGVCDGNDWSPWQAPPVGGGALGSAPAAVSWGSGRIDVFTRGTDSTPYHVSFDNGSWGPGWVPLGGQTFHAPAVASPGQGRLYLFVRGTNGILYRQRFVNGAWDGQWEGRGGRNARFKDAPAAVQASSSNGGCPTGSGGWLHVLLRGGGSGELHHLRDCPD